MIKNLVILSISATSLLQVGCASFKYQSAHSTAPELPASFNEQYRIDEVRFISDPRAKRSSDWGDMAEKEVSKEIIEQALVSAYPSIFSLADEATPIDVTLKFSETIAENKLGWYILSLGILPTKATRIEDVIVVVSKKDLKQVGNIKFNYQLQFSIFTPLAWSSNDTPEFGYNGVHELTKRIQIGGGYYAKDTQKRLFVTELTEEIYSAICSMNQKK